MGFRSLLVGGHRGLGTDEIEDNKEKRTEQDFEDVGALDRDFFKASWLLEEASSGAVTPDLDCARTAWRT